MTASHNTQSRRFDRRTFFRGALFVGLGATAAATVAACSDSASDKAQLTQPTPRGADAPARALPIPPLEEGTKKGATRTIMLTAAASTAEIVAGTQTKTWGFSADFLGPTLRAKRGEKVKISVTNDLDEMTTVHWHGMKLPAKADGGPHTPIEPGKTWDAAFTVDQPAATVWYHPHPHERTALHCYRGLAGMFIVDDEVEEKLDLPREYGVDDIPVVVVDAKFTDDGQLDETIDPTFGLKGTTPLVNGITNPELTAKATRLRLRLLNGAGMRFYTFALSNGAPLQIIATDAGLLDAPVEADEVLMGPGERVEVIVDLTPGEDVTLRSVARDDNFGIPEPESAAAEQATGDFGFRDEFDILHIKVPAELKAPEKPLPAKLDPAAADVPAAEGLTERDFVLNTFMINGEHMDMNRVDVVIDHKKPEIWTVTNENADWPHNFHIHNCRFKVLELNQVSTDVAVQTIGWKDTVDLPPKSTAKLLVDFAWHPDPKIPYMFHCHMLLHEDKGMMGQFVMVEPGDEPALPTVDHGVHGDHVGHGTDSGNGDAAGTTATGGAKGNPGGHQKNLSVE